MEKREEKEENEAYSQIDKIQGSLSHIAKIIDNYEKNVVKSYEKRLYQTTTKLDLINNKLLEKEVALGELRKENKSLKQRDLEHTNALIAEERKNQALQAELKKANAINQDLNAQIISLNKTVDKLSREVWLVAKNGKEKSDEIRFSYDKKIKDLVKDYSEKEVAMSAKVHMLLKEVEKYKLRINSQKELKKDLLEKIQKELEEKE